MNNELSNKAKAFSDRLSQLCKEYDVTQIVSISQTSNGDLWPMLITMGADVSPAMKLLMEAVLETIRQTQPHIPTRMHRKTPDGWNSKDLY